MANPYYLPLIHARLNKNLSDFYAIMKEEMWLAFDDYIGSPIGMFSLDRPRTFFIVRSLFHRVEEHARATNLAEIGLQNG